VTHLAAIAAGLLMAGASGGWRTTFVPLQLSMAASQGMAAAATPAASTLEISSAVTRVRQQRAATFAGLIAGLPGLVWCLFVRQGLLPTLMEIGL
jgi:hypothetical protein